MAGARSALLAAGVRPQNIAIESVPGSYELPLAAQRLYAASQIQASKSTAAASAKALERKYRAEGDVGEEGEERKDAFDAVIAIGVLIKGETMHFEYIAEAVSHGLMRVQLDAGVPVVFGLLTVLTEEQAMARAGMDGGLGKGHNHGEDWGAAAVELGVKQRAWAEGRVG